MSIRDVALLHLYR